MRISDWSSDVCSSDLTGGAFGFDRLAQAFVDTFVRVQAQHPVMLALFDRESLLAAEAVERPLQHACAQAFAQLASAVDGARIDHHDFVAERERKSTR